MIPLRPSHVVFYDKFGNVELVEDFWSQHAGRPVKEVRFYLRHQN
jgi:hypothetical protein